MKRIGHNKYCTVTSQGSLYTFHDVRDFRWIREDYQQEQNWITETYDLEALSGLDIVICPFGFMGLLVHSLLTFHFSDGKEITLSIEGQLEQGQEYNLLKAIFGGYYNLYIRGTKIDHVGLRLLQKEHPISYPLHIRPSHIKQVFIALVERTKEAYTKHEKYALITNSCTTALWKSASYYFPIPRRHRALFFVPRLVHLLKKEKVIRLNEKKELRK